MVGGVREGEGRTVCDRPTLLSFSQDHDLQLIVRAHECVMDGFERVAQGHLITLFSATNYCGTANNAGERELSGSDSGRFPAARASQGRCVPRSARARGEEARARPRKNAP